MRDAAFFRPQRYSPETLADFYPHVASPEVLVDAAHRRLLMWVHGWWTNGERWPRDPDTAAAWAREHGYGRSTASRRNRATAFTSSCGQRSPGQSYLRVFERDRFFYAVARLGRLARSRDPDPAELRRRSQPVPGHRLRQPDP